jgi:hypothetical protein
VIAARALVAGFRNTTLTIDRALGEFLRPRARAREGKAQGFRQFSGVAISFKTSNPLIFLDSRIRG